jgi:pimeloyl-ACP methyl ester carboxylesterase
MLGPALSLLLILPILAGIVVAAFVVYLIVCYSPIIGRIFEEKPMFLPLRLAPRSDGEDVRFRTEDGLELGGTYLPARSASRAGVLVFCHEFLSDRWSYEPYADGLRDRGFDIFTFDFRNHGRSASVADYEPLQWVSDHEVRDLQAALAYLRSRGDRDPAGFGLIGISRGGGTALVVASGQVDVWGIITDGAFPTRGTMLAYILRWAEIFVNNRAVYAILRDYTPYSVFNLMGSVGRRRAERRLSCRFADIEAAVSRLAPRSWLMIHGARDAYIGPEIAQRLFDEGGEPKELWIVPGAKHNRCREVDPAAYAGRIEAFLRRSAPRPLADPTPESPAELPTGSLEQAPALSESESTPPAPEPAAAGAATVLTA